MTKFTTLRRSAVKVAVSTTLTLFASVTAFAQSTILVVDTAKVYNDSAVGNHITRQLQSMASTTETELKAQATPLETRQKSLKLRTDGKTNDQILGDAALVSQIQTLQKDAVKLQQDMQIAQRELQLTEAKARQLVTAKMKTIIDQIARERNADVVLERQLVIYGEPADITTTVLARLDSQMTTVPVTRERLPRQ